MKYRVVIDLVEVVIYAGICYIQLALKKKATGI